MLKDSMSLTCVSLNCYVPMCIYVCECVLHACVYACVRIPVLYVIMSACIHKCVCVCRHACVCIVLVHVCPLDYTPPPLLGVKVPHRFSSL